MSRPAHQSVTDVWTNATAQGSSAALAWHQARQGVAEKAALSFRRTCAPGRMVPFGRTLKENNSWRGPEWVNLVDSSTRDFVRLTPRSGPFQRQPVLRECADFVAKLF